MNTTVIRTGSRWRVGLVAVLLCGAGGVAVGEWLGWPFLAAPLQNFLSDKLDRKVRFADEGAAATGFAVRFLGGIRLQAPLLQIAAPAWSTAPYMLRAEDVALELGYSDLWRAYQGEPVRIHSLQARTLDGNIERMADGRASWQFGKTPPAAQPDSPTRLPQFGTLRVTNGLVHYTDAPLSVLMDATLSLLPGSVAADGQTTSLVKVEAKGRYRKQPLKIVLSSSAVLPSEGGNTSVLPVVVNLNATVGRAQLDFNGMAPDALKPQDFSGRFSLNGPSLAAVGDPLGVTLPTTEAFKTNGTLVKTGSRWQVVVNDATVGASRLHGAFRYESAGRVPMLSGKLGGSRLLLADLGPVVGTTATEMADTATPVANNARAKGRVLPDRPFDLPSLRAMNANVLIDIGEVNLNTSYLEPLQPLAVHLELDGGVLRLHDLVARTAQGQLRGDLALDGRGEKALWTADLRWDGVRLERWIKVARADGAPPYVSGQLYGQAKLAGQGRSTAQILASLQGTARTTLRNGTVSHLGVELAGLDIAQSLGMLVKGDDALPVRCAVADLVAKDGNFRPKVMVVDTTDSAVWVDGSLSLATEALDLRAVVVPKDFSPLSVRTPIRVQGTFSQPQVSLEKEPLAKKAAASLLLALVNPLAAVIPWVDLGDADAAKRGASGCAALTQRSTGQK
ncbi:AsmA family protein [Rhodoferax sp. WC2427]|uniref:AsmA family protein n=1 Tax=Rhodoferax sp. WC2427 TaxID=3234144 RepID=UPI0034650152